MMLPISGVEAVLASRGISIAEDLSPGATADCTRDRISDRTEIDILGGACGNIPAHGAADDLDDQIDE